MAETRPIPALKSTNIYYVTPQSRRHYFATRDESRFACGGICRKYLLNALLSVNPVCGEGLALTLLIEPINLAYERQS